MKKNNETLKTLLKIAREYNLNIFIKELKNLQTKSRVTLGFLGEFNSGKSTLINALIGKKLLPAMERPTTKNIIFILPDSKIEEPRFFEEKDGEFVEIEPLRFQEIALGKAEGNAMVKVKPSKYLPEGFIIIDTPGISSLDETDETITLGYLPELDAAVICQDITFGTIPESVIKFLKKPEVKKLLEKIIFTLTKSDRIGSNDAKKIKEHTIKVLEDLYKEADIKTNVAKRVSITSAEKALNGDIKGIEEFLQSLKECILDKKEKLEEERKTKILKEIAKKLALVLEEYKNNIRFSPEEINKNIEKIKDEIQELERERRKANERAKLLEEILEKDIFNILNKYKKQISQIEDEEELRTILSEIENEIAEDISRRIQQVLKLNADTTIPSELTLKINERIKSELSKIKFAKLVLLSIFIAVIGPEQGAKNAIEFGIGPLIEKSGALIEKVKETTSKSEKLAGIVKKISQSEKFKKVMPFLKVVPEIAKYVDPTEYIITPVRKGWLKNRYEKVIKTVSEEAAKNITCEIELILRTEVFDKLEEELKNKKETLKKLRVEKRKKLKETEELKVRVEEEIKLLKTIAEVE